MYNRDLETSADVKRQYNDNQRKAAAERLAKVAALKKLKKPVNETPNGK